MLYGNRDNDTVFGGDGADTLYGGQGDDWLSGGDGSNVLFGGDGVDTADYSGFNFSIVAGIESGTVLFGAETDTILSIENIVTGSGGDYLTGSATNNRLDGGAGNDTIDGLGNPDILIGGSGNDSILGRADGETIDGGTGVDIVNFIHVGNAPMRVEFETGRIELLIDGQLHLRGHISNVENLIATPAADTLAGNTGDNLLFAGAGHDLIIATIGNDVYTGDVGNDTVDFTYIDVELDIDLAASTADFIVDETTPQQIVLSSIEAIIGGGMADTISLTDANDITFGGFGDDIIYGLGGNDLIYGNRDSDIIRGDAGNDTIFGGQEADTISAGTGDDVVFGNMGDDIIRGGAGSDTLYGGQGNDTIETGGGADVIYGNLGDGDIVDFAGDNLSYIIDLANDRANYIDFQANPAALFIIGIEGAVGGNGDDSVIGDSFNNLIGGGQGTDTLIGGLGNDTFRFETGEENDLISDFADIADTLLLDIRLGVSSAAEAMAVASVAENGTDTVFNFVSGDTLTLAGILPTGISDGSFVFYDSLMP